MIKERILELEQQVFASPYELNCFKKLVYLNWRNNRKTTLIVATMNSYVVGYILTSIKEHKQSLLIMSLAIDREYHGRGVGSELLKFVIQHTSVNHPKVNSVRYFLPSNHQTKSSVILWLVLDSDHEILLKLLSRFGVMNWMI
jgi:ribosomal protein S18 acetylase RimI-like enzyme